jgi:hypothetical protein
LRNVGRRKKMSVQRKRYSADEKTRVAIEAMKGRKTLNELAAECSRSGAEPQHVLYILQSATASSSLRLPNSGFHPLERGREKRAATEYY